MGGDGIGVVGVCRVLHRAEVLHLQIVGYHHKPAGVLAGGAPDAHASQGEPILLRPSCRNAVFLQILFYKPVGGLFRQGADGARPEHLGLTEHLNGVAVGPRLILAGEIQVNIRHLASAKAQERLKGDVKAVLGILLAAHRAHLVRHVRSAAVRAVHDKFAVLALGTAVVGRQRVDLGDAGHISHQRRAHRSPRAYQIAVLQTPLHQFLGRHVHHVILAQNTAQLHVQPVYNQLGRILAVESVGLLPRVFQTGRKQLLGKQWKGLHHVRDAAGIGHYHLISLLLSKIRKLPEHFICCFEVDRQRLVGVREFLGRQQDVAVDLVLRLQEVDVAGGAHQLAQFLPQTDNRSVEFSQVLLRLHVAVAEHEGVVAQGLNL